MIAEFIYQTIYILFPLFLYFFLVEHTAFPKKYKQQLLGVLCAVTIFITMTFPVSYNGQYLLDLRYIPWLIAFLYGNRTTALLLTAGMVFYRFTLSGDGFYIFITAYGITIALLFLYYKQYLWFSFRKKLIATVGITILYASIVVSLIHFFLPEPFQFEPFFFTFVVMHPLMTGLCIYVIEMYRENERLRMEIQRGERMDTVSQMAASVAHEIRNPMTVVRGFTQLLQRDSRVQEHHHAKLELMLHELDRAENIIKDYLTLAKPALNGGLTGEIHLKKLLETMKSTVGSYGIINGVEIEYIDKLPDDVTINGNNEKFQQVLMNMIKNAIEASSRGQNVEVKCFKKGEEVKIRISDAGSGIKEDHLKLLGTPFYSTKEEGTGLGLSVSYKIVEAMGGSIMVESRENEGTAFTISLPIASEK